MRRVFLSDMGAALAGAMALTLAAKKYKPAPPTPAQADAADKRSERQKWNDEVAQRKADKQASKHKATQ